jgi:hypothetical protein
MIQLTYISSAVRGLDELAVNDILKASRNNNASVGVTGLLLYNGRRFLQVLEGMKHVLRPPTNASRLIRATGAWCCSPRDRSSSGLWIVGCGCPAG